MKNMRQWLFGMLLLNLLTGAAYAQPAGNRIIEETNTLVTEGCTRVDVKFTVPMQYLSHFPKENGKELRIQFRPLVANAFDAPALSGNEHVRLMEKELGFPLKDFEYDGHYSAGQPTLIMTFGGPVNFKVEPDSNFRGISIYLSVRPLSGCKILP